jgi:hypothetical protein
MTMKCVTALVAGLLLSGCAIERTITGQVITENSEGGTLQISIEKYNVLGTSYSSFELPYKKPPGARETYLAYVKNQWNYPEDENVSLGSFYPFPLNTDEQPKTPETDVIQPQPVEPNIATVVGDLSTIIDPSVAE